MGTGYYDEEERSDYWRNVDAAAEERAAKSEERDRCDRTPRGVWCSLCAAKHQRDGDKVR